MIVEDEQPIRTMISYALSRAGYELIEAESAREANEQIARRIPDIILMDWMLSGQSGVELTKRLKREVATRHIPVIMLTARAEETEKITGLNAGADDYMTKPFSPGELVARIHAVLRRAGQYSSEQDVLTCNSIELDPGSYRVTIHGEEIHTGPTEYRLLKFFMKNPNRVYSREQLLNRVWGQNVYVEERTVDVHILRLRKHLQPYDHHIQTVRGAGYRFSPG